VIWRILELELLALDVGHEEILVVALLGTADIRRVFEEFLAHPLPFLCGDRLPLEMGVDAAL